MATIETLIKFRNIHRDCGILLDEYNKTTGTFIFTCSKHNEAVITDAMPRFCNYPSLDCAIRGYCNREYACND